LSVYFHHEEGVIAESLNLTVSLRGNREVRDNSQLFRLTGLLDAFSEPTFRKVLGSKIEEGPKHIILDLSQIDFVDSSGLGALVQLAKQAQNADGTLQIVTNARVTQTVKLVRLEKFLSLQTSVEAALKNIPSPWLVEQRDQSSYPMFDLNSWIFRNAGLKTSLGVGEGKKPAV